MPNSKTNKTLPLIFAAFLVMFLVMFLALTALPGSQAFAAFGDAPAASEPINTNPLQASSRLQPSVIEEGGTGDIVVEMKLDKGYHAYLERFKLAIESPDDIKLGDIKVSPLVKFKDIVSKSMKDGVAEKGTLRALIEIPKGFAPGDHTLKFKLGYQACTDDHCLFPKFIEQEVPFQVIAAPKDTSGNAISKDAPKVETSTGALAPLEPPKSEFHQALQKGAFATLAFIFVVGFLTSLTPCIYPMIPITVAILGAGARGRSHVRSFALSLVYVLGICLTYSILGITAASTGALFGSLLSNIWVVTALALVFVAMALSMYGAFEIQPPMFIRDRLGNAQTGSGFSGAFSAGLIAGVVASPCVGPVLVSILAHIAQTQDRVLGFLYLFVFALGLGVPFIAIGTSSHLLNKLPKAGPWMESVKFIFGTVMIAMALYYVRPLYPIGLFHFLQGLAAVLIASFYGAFESNDTLTPIRRLRKGVMLAAFVVGIVFATTGLARMAGVQLPGASLVTGETSAKSYPELNWRPYSAEAVANAQKTGRPVIIDFYADWCGACVELEEYTYTDSRVQDLSRRFELLKVDATNDFPDLAKLQSEYKVQGLPTIIFYDGNGKRRDDLTLTGFEKAEDFQKRMNSALVETPKFKAEGAGKDY